MRSVIKGFRLVVYGAFLLGAAMVSFAQSNDPAFPTPITTNEISGIIPARAIGDPRQTTYYFTFNGGRGDVFINIVTENFKGEIDVFTALGLEPKTKITIYADNPERETGRVIYQRQPEKLILRIQGRTPNDDPATFRLKFAGSFAPITGAEAAVSNEFPDVLGEKRGDVRVSPSGEILPPEKVPVPENPVEAVADRPVTEEPAGDPKREEAGLPEDDVVTDEGKETVVKEKTPRAKPVVIITDDLAPPAEEPRRDVTVEVTEDRKAEVSAVVTIERVPEKVPEESEAANEVKEPVEAAVPNPLANVFLRVEMKNGNRFEKRMTEVAAVNVINGRLTIVLTDGTRREIDILSVLRMTIE